MRAVVENKTLVKFEIESGKVYLIMAAPYEVNGEPRALELIKDITQTNFVETVDRNKTTDYSELIALLNQAIVTDDLTGLYNKRYVEEHLPYDIKMISFSDKKIFVGIADIDHFKAVNDRYGHLVGDKVLTSIGKILKSSIRSEGDWIARYGGEEFLIVIKGEDEKIFNRVCERIRKEVEDTKMQFSDHEFNVTISIGGIGIHPSAECRFEDLISKADANLYRAKENGRNQCIVEYKSAEIKA